MNGDEFDDWEHGRLVDEIRRLRAARQQAESADDAKSEFLASMSHELRTPLNSILGFSDMIQNERLGPVGTPRYREYAGDIISAGRHLLDLINDILDISRIEAGTLDVIPEPLEVRPLLEGCVTMMAPRAADSGISLALDIQDGLALLMADERHIRQIVLNLITNSIKFTPEGGHIKVGARPTADPGVAIHVRDTGIGIAANDIPKILKPFGQIAKNLTRPNDGVGLGVPLARSLAELNGASFELESVLGEGTTVTLRFPYARVLTWPRRLVADIGS